MFGKILLYILSLWLLFFLIIIVSINLPDLCLNSDCTFANTLNFIWNNNIIKFNIPVIAYNVSGEYAMVKAAAQNGWIDEKSIVLEQMYAFKRAGATGIITYFAKHIASYLDE